MHPIHQWREVQEQLRLNKIYQGLRVDSRPRYIFHGKSDDYYRKFQPHKKTIALFPPLSGNRKNGIIIPGLRTRYIPIMGGSPTNYYMRADGTAATYDLAVGPGTTQANCMSIATHDAAGDVYLGGDILSICDDGGVYRDQLDVQSSGASDVSRIVYQPETGDSPQIYGSTQATTWADQGSNKWKCSYATEPERVWFINTDTTIKWGNKVVDTDSLAAEYDWVWVSNELWCYAATDPDSRYTSVEGSQRGACIYGSTKHYITVSGVECAFSKDWGIGNYHSNYWNVDDVLCHHIGMKGVDGRGVQFRDASNCALSNSTIHNIGVSGVYPISADGGDITNITIESNVFYDIYHSAIDFLRFGTGSGNGTGNIVRYNEVYHTSDYDNNYSSNAVFFKGISGIVFTSPSIYYNFAHDMYEYGGEAMYILDQYVTGAEFYNNVAATSLGALVRHGFDVRSSSSTIIGVKIKNNISRDMSGYVLKVADSASVSECDYNCWYNLTGDYVLVDAVGYDSTEFAAYKSATGWDTNGLWQDPLFRSSSDFHLQSGSPCIEAGTPIAGLTKDFYGVPLGRGTNPDMGASETLKGGPRRL